MRINEVSRIYYTPKAANYRPQTMPSKDTVSFTRNAGLAGKYNININKIKVDATPNAGNIDETEKRMLVEKILEAHEHAKKNVLNGNISGSGYASSIRLSTGQWDLGTNFNNTRDEVSSVCGERSAILNAYNKFLNAINLSAPKSQISEFKVDYITMSSFKEPGTDKNTIPCAECLSWFNTTRLFSDNTKIASLSKEENGNLKLVVKTLKDYLPLRNERANLTSLYNWRVQASDKALKTMQERNMSAADLKILFKAAKDDYENNRTFAPKFMQSSAAVLDNDGDVTTGRRLNWSTRWFMEPAELAISKVIEEKPNAKIGAIAYYGESSVNTKGGILDESIVSLQTLGRLLSVSDDPDALVVTMVDDKLKIRTIDDYLPAEARWVQAFKR